MPFPYFIVDAFTDQPFHGNPAAVCLLDSQYETPFLQSFAAELNLSETAFLLPQKSRWNLRWFSPRTEVDLCGHATLAAANILWETRHALPEQPITFDTRSGPITCTHRADWIRMDFPAECAVPVADPALVTAALGPVMHAHPILKNRFDYLVELPDESAVRDFIPNLPAIAKLPARGLIITAPSADPRFDFVSRFFAPALGIPEDPVTGSAHCALAPYWSPKLNKTEFIARQLSPRGGTLRLKLNNARVFISGQALTVSQAQWL